MLTEFFQLLENKNRFIDANPNLTEDQKEELKKFFLKYPHLESKMGDWQKSKDWTWETFQPVMDEAKKTSFEKKQGTIDGLVINKDYRIIYDDGSMQVYEPLTHKGSWILASNAVGPEIWTPLPSWYSTSNADEDYIKKDNTSLYSGAKWCISMKHSSKYWDDYISRGIAFLFIINNNAEIDNFKKLAFTQHFTNEEPSALDIFDAADNSISSRNYLLAHPDINKAYEIWLRKSMATGAEYVDNLLTKGILVKVGDEFDCKDTSKANISRIFDPETDFFIKFRKWYGDWNCNGDPHVMVRCPREVYGNFNCSGLGLKSLKGSPSIVRGNFICENNELTSLEGAPEVVRDFKAGHNNLKSLRGPKKVLGCLYAGHNQLQTFEGMPEVKGLLDVSFNPDLKSYDGLNLASTGWIITRGTGLEEEEENEALARE